MKTDFWVPGFLPNHEEPDSKKQSFNAAPCPLLFFYSVFLGFAYDT